MSDKTMLDNPEFDKVYDSRCGRCGYLVWVHCGADLTKSPPPFLIRAIDPATKKAVESCPGCGDPIDLEPFRRRMQKAADDVSEK
jgi:ribosomal protein S27AE